MSSKVEQLPDDPALLKALLVQYQDKEHRFESQIKKLTQQVHDLFEALRLERHRHYGTKSEKAPGHGELFDEVESDTDEELTESSDNDSSKQESTKLNSKKPGVRKPLPAEMPRVEHVHELSDEEKICSCGCMMNHIGEHVSEQLDIEPAKVQVIRHIRHKYACHSCEESIKTAEAPKLLLPKAIASANTMAYLITAKYADGLPLYRLSGILKRYGVSLPRQTLSESVLAVTKKLEPLIECLEQGLRRGSLIYMD